MNYDYTFFEQHMRKLRTIECFNDSTVTGEIYNLYGPEQAKDMVEMIVPTTLDIDKPAIFRCRGVYSLGGKPVDALEKAIDAKFPDDFVQFYERFGSCVIVTASMSVRIFDVSEMIEQYRDDSEWELEDGDTGRFVRFAGFDGMIFDFGLRREHGSLTWDVAYTDHGLLFSEIITEQGRENTVAPSFYEWLRTVIETDVSGPFGADDVRIIEDTLMP